jgi:alcohol dehydrogenase class IV
MIWEFATSARIVFGEGAFAQAPLIARSLGSRPLLVTGKSRRFADGFLSCLGESAAEFMIPSEPTVQIVREGVAICRSAECECVVAIGGGSVIDAGKAIAALARNPNPIEDYLEIVGTGKMLERAPLPFVAIPTTAGTGAEATRNAVIGAPEQRIKVSLRSPFMLPRCAIVDPALTYELPAKETGFCGLDAITQLIEPFVSSSANPIADALCREGIRLAAAAFPRVLRNGADHPARRDMAMASLFGGMALANARLGAVHGLAGPLGGMLSAPHGALCARLLPFVMEANIEAAERSKESKLPCVMRFREIAVILTQDHCAQPKDAVTCIACLCDEAKIKPLHAWGLEEKAMDEAADKAFQSSSIKGNPVALSREELKQILRNAL